MTRDGLTEENLRDGSVKDISHRSRGRPENKEEFVPERERKKAENEDTKSGKGKRLQMEKVRKSSVRQEAVEDTVEVTPEEKVSGYRKKLHRHEKIPDDDNNLNSQKKSIRKKQQFLVKDKKRSKEINIYIALMIFYLLYSLVIKVTTPRGVMLDFLQQLRPYAVFYLTWMLAPQFSPKQKKHIKWIMLLSFFGYLFAFKFKPSLVTPYGGAESAALGQIALCCAMVYYLFSKQTTKNRNIAILIMLLGLASGKSKYFGECVCFIALVMFVKSKINFTSVFTLLKLAALGAVVRGRNRHPPFRLDHSRYSP